MKLLCHLIAAAMTAMIAHAAGLNGFERQTFWAFTPEMSDAEMQKEVDVIAAAGANCVILGGGAHHYLADSDRQTLDRYLNRAALAVKLCHEKGIKVVEHHSNVLISPANCTAALEPMLLQGFSDDGGSGVWPEYNARSFCPNNPQYREMYWQKLSSMLARVDFDGIMSDDASFHAGCSCAVCQARWTAENGGDIFSAYKAAKTIGSPAWNLWNATRKRWITEYYMWLSEKLRSEYPSIVRFTLANDSTSPWPSQINGLYPELFAYSGDLIVWEIYNPADFFSVRRLGVSAAVYREMCESPAMRAKSFCILAYADTAEHRDVFDPSEDEFMWAFAMTVGGDFCFGRVFLTGITAKDSPGEVFNFEKKYLANRKNWGNTYAGVAVVFNPLLRDTDPNWEAGHTVPFNATMQTLQAQGVPAKALIPDSRMARGIKIYAPKDFLPASYFVNQVNENDRFPAIPDYSAAAIDKSTSPILLVTEGEAPLFRVYKKGGVITIPMTNTLGAKLPPGTAVPSPAKAVWGAVKPVTVRSTARISAAELLTYPDGKYTPLKVTDDGHSVTLNSPEKFQVLTLQVER
ncbi:MAG: hypothetical protein PHI85_00155 [Victivallaceae bacterium]|nr:hypothetical protein [Victivallaceae bacterium]